MTTHIPSPPSQKLPPAHQHGLHRGVYLEQNYPWQRVIKLLFIGLPVLWLLYTALLWGINRQEIPFLRAFAYAGLSFPVLFVIHYLTHILSRGPRLSIRDELLELRDTQQRWTLKLSAPYTASILYRDTHEDALLVLQNQSGSTSYIYGRYRMHHALPPHAIPTAQLGFSLAEWAIDTLGAPMLPDKEVEHLPLLIGHLLTTPGYHPHPRFLPLRPHPQRLRLDAAFMVWSQQGEFQRKFHFPSSHVQPFRLAHQNGSQLFLHIESLETHNETPDDQIPPSLWIATEWPVNLTLETCSPLPSAPPAAQTLHLPWIDTLFLVQYLERRGIFPAPFSLFTTNPE